MHKARSPFGSLDPAGAIDEGFALWGSLDGRPIHPQPIPRRFFPLKIMLAKYNQYGILTFRK